MSDAGITRKGPFSLRRLLIGARLHTAEMSHQTVGKTIGLAIFASDALSSVAYATDEILFVLILAGAGALYYSLPIAIAIIILLAIVTISYRQTIHAYPCGGGAYIVGRDNIGEVPAQIAGAALLVDYILTVAVSMSSGVAQIASAFPALNPWRVSIALCIIGFMTLVNLRGVKESGRVFSLPTYFFLFMTLFTIVIGFYHYFTGTLGMVTGIEPLHGGAIQALTLFLVLRAFSSGCAALTGVEAISNGVTAFKEPRSHNAGITLIWMSTILSAMFFGITFLARHTGAIPSQAETV
ncbi:MAG: APC family permease, partial [Nitrospirae bacterium]|nr:APC family permease [Nitrospirota bacterium]